MSFGKSEIFCAFMVSPSTHPKIHSSNHFATNDEIIVGYLQKLRAARQKQQGWRPLAIEDSLGGAWGHGTDDICSIDVWR